MFKRKNIWFYCPACDRKLVVGVEAAGLRADCPECGVNIPIPARSTALPNWTQKAAVYLLQGILVATAALLGWRLARETGPAGETQSHAEKEVPAATTAPSAGDSTPAKEDEQSVAAAEINRQLLDEHVALQGRYNKMLQWMIDNYRGKYPLPDRLVGRLRIPAMTDQGEVHPDLVEMLQLSEEEKAQVKDVMTYALDGMRQAERERVQVSEQADHRITFSVPTFPEAGASLREDLFLTLETTLGEHRFDRMVDVAGEAMREKLHYFGEASRTLTFEVIFPSVESGHPPYLLIRDGWVVPDGDSVRLTKVTETAVTSLPESYQPYRDWLPENLSRFAVP